MKTKCQDCGKKLPAKSHFNRKRCVACAKYRVAHPKHSLTKKQQAMARRLAGTMYYEKLAKHIGCSRSSLSRFAREAGFSLNHLSYKPEFVGKVTAFYEKHGKIKTAEKFPDANVRSIVERYRIFKPRQIRWTEAQILEATKMAGLVSYEAQAKFFNRPNANAPSVKSLWVKRFGYRGSSLNGMAHWYACRFVTSGVKYLQPIGEARTGERVLFKRLILWVDMEKCLKPDAPQFVIEAVKTMADFQRWIWSSDNPKPMILKMIKERELEFPA